MRIVVVTASIGERGALYTPTGFSKDSSVEYVCFSDRKLRHSVWRCRRVKRLFADPCRDAKRFKILARDYVDDDVDATIWIDRHCRLTCKPEDVFAEFDEDVVLVDHYRNCIFREARACVDAGKDVREIIRPMMQRFRLEGHPPKSGLHYGGFVVRRHTEAEERFSRLWWNYVETGSRRDQLSLPVALKRSGVSFRSVHRRRRGEFFTIRGG